MRALRHLILAAAAFAFSAQVLADDLRVGVAVEPVSMDPHYLTGPDNAVNRHIFDRLLNQDERQRVQPGLAVSWQAVDDLTWEFKLRPNVKFHDGAPFTAEDVAFSFERAREVKSSSPISTYLRQVKSVEIVDPLTIRITTTQVYPMLPNDLGVVAIISKAVKGATDTGDFNSGKSAIGTGPYKLVEYVPGDRIVLKRFDDYWGSKPAWANVTLRALKNDSSRLAALLAGDVDMINAIPPTDFVSLQKDKRFSVVTGAGNRLIYIQLDSERDDAPFITGKDGKPLGKNPMKDAKVREAMSIALNRTALVERILDGQGIAASQLLPDGTFGTSPDLKIEKFDLGRAKALLKEAGYPDGFGFTLHCPSDRFVRAQSLCQAMAQMWSRAGLDAKLEMLPSNVYLTRNGKREFSVAAAAWSTDTGDITSPMRALLATVDIPRGMGQANRGGYSNQAFDKELVTALQTMDAKKREEALQKASQIAIQDHGLLPIFYQLNSWASRNGIAYTARAEEFPMAFSASPAEK